MSKEKLEHNSKHKGITLVALIITIIVILILVGVSVTVALKGGLFTTAKDATKQTQIEQEKEQLLSAALGAIKNKRKVDLDKLTANLPEGFREISLEATEKTRTYASESGNKYVVDENRKIEYAGQADDPLEMLSDYILGEREETTGQRPGRNLSEIVQGGKITIINLAFISIEKIEKVDAEANIAYDTLNYYDVYFTHEGRMYKFRFTENLDTRETVTLAEAGIKEISYDTTSKVGKHVSYDGVDWIVLYDDSENGLQMISADVITDKIYYLGIPDETITESEVTEIDGIEGKSRVEKTIYSYNKSVKTLNAICEGLVTPKVGVIKGVRSVGSDPIRPNEDNEKPFIASKDTIPGYKTSTWIEDNLNLQLNKTDEKTYYTIKGTNPAQEYKIKNEDENYEKDYNRMVALGINAIESSYFLASTCVYSAEEVGKVHFGMRIQEESLNFNNLWAASLEGIQVMGSGMAANVRPVVILETGALDGLTGDGLTAETAYQLD